MNRQLSYISLLRVFAMILVVFYHCFYCYVGWKETAYSSEVDAQCWILASNLSYIHVPLFLLISGYVYAYNRYSLNKYQSLSQFICRKSKRVLFPYVFWGGILIMTQNRSFDQFLNGIAHLWFLLVIFECYLLFRLLDKIFEKKSMVTISLLFLAVYLLACSRIHTGISLFCLDSFLQYFPYYLAGIVFYQLNIVDAFCKKKAVALLICSCVTWCLCLKFGLFIKLFSLELLLALLIVVSKYSYENSVITSLDKYSMGIYIIHQPLLQELSLLPIIKDFRDTHYYIYPFVAFVLVLMVSWLVTKEIKQTKFSLLLG